MVSLSSLCFLRKWTGNFFPCWGTKKPLKHHEMFIYEPTLLCSNEKCVCEGRWEEIPYGHRPERKCHHMGKNLNMSLIRVKVSRDNWYYLVRFLCMKGYRDWLPGSCSEWTIHMEQSVHLGTVLSLYWWPSMVTVTDYFLLLSPEGISILNKMSFLLEAKVWDVLLIDRVVLHLWISCLSWKGTLPATLAPYACNFS